jgi:hypothetical protein
VLVRFRGTARAKHFGAGGTSESVRYQGAWGARIEGAAVPRKTQGHPSAPRRDAQASRPQLPFRHEVAS